MVDGELLTGANVLLFRRVIPLEERWVEWVMLWVALLGVWLAGWDGE